MSNSKKRMASFLLAFVMVVGLAVPGMAAEAKHAVTLRVSTDNRYDRYEYAAGATMGKLLLYTVGATDVESIQVTSGDYSQTHTSYSNITGTLPNGTSYRINGDTDSNGIFNIYFDTTNALQDDIDIEVTPKSTSYDVVSNSGSYNVNNNYGDNGNATCTVDEEVQTVAGGESWSVTFQPHPGQEITHLNIRPEYTNRTNLVSAATGTVTVSGRTYQIETAANGTVTLRCASATCDVFVTALTQAQKSRFTLSVSTDSNCSSNIKSTTVTQGESKTVTLTPVSGYNINEITITANGRTATMSYKTNSVNVDGKTYSVSRKLDGSAVLSIPAMSSDVTVQVNASSGTHYVTVTPGRHTSSSEEGTRFVGQYESYTVTFSPRSGAVIRNISVTTGRGTYTANVTDAYIVVEGTYYRLYTDYDGDLTLYLTDIPTNMEITVNAKDTSHDVTVRTDNGCDSDRSTYYVEDGDDLEVEFTPTKSKYTIREIRVSYDGTTYKADPRSDSYVRVNGTRWPISMAYDGTVTLSMVGIEYDVTVNAYTNYTSSGTYRISKSTDSHSNVTFTGSNPFDDGDSTTIKVTTDNKYIVDTVKFTMNGKSATVEPFDTSFRLGSTTYRVVWVDNTEFSVYFSTLTANLTVTAKSEKGSVETPTYPPDYNVTPGTYHKAFMVGYGNGYFGPGDALSRAQAVTLLVRAFCDQNDANVSGYNGYGVYSDVAPYTWCAGYINYASSYGYLSVLGNSGYFYPNRSITRAEFLALLCSFHGVDVSGASAYTGYTDVPSNYWAAKYISYATDQGWVQGTGNGYFQPDRSVTRAEICVMVNHILGRAADRQQTYGIRFLDVPTTYWAYYDIAEASNSHYINGMYAEGEVWSYGY